MEKRRRDFWDRKEPYCNQWDDEKPLRGENYFAPHVVELGRSFYLRGESPGAISKALKNRYGGSGPTEATVRRWMQKYHWERDRQGVLKQVKAETNKVTVETIKKVRERLEPIVSQLCEHVDDALKNEKEKGLLTSKDYIGVLTPMAKLLSQLTGELNTNVNITVSPREQAYERIVGMDESKFKGVEIPADLKLIE
jgi:hypothetical protein